MRNKIMMFVAAGMLTIGGLAYGFATSNNSSCPLEGTSYCPKINCPLADTPECPIDNVKTVELSYCCKKK